MAANDPKKTEQVRLADDARSTNVHGSSRAEHVEVEHDSTAQEAWIGTAESRRHRGNLSWGAVFAGAITFIALTILLGVGAAALGLQNAGGVAVGIWTLIGLAIAFAAAGYVAGALGVRAGMFHGFLTWATSLVGLLTLAGLAGAGALGVVGNIAGTVAETVGNAANVTSEDAENAATEASEAAENVNTEEVRASAEAIGNDIAETAREAAPQIAAGSWWTFAGLLTGAAISSLTGAAGARSVMNRDDEELVARPRKH